MQNPGSDAGVFHFGLTLSPLVIPGRRGASSPESITTGLNWISRDRDQPTPGSAPQSAVSSNRAATSSIPFSRDRGHLLIANLKPNPLVYTITRPEAVHDLRPMLICPPHDIVGHARIERAVLLARKEIDVVRHR